MILLFFLGWTWTGITTSGTNPLQLDAKDKPAGAWTAEQVAKFLEERMGQNKFYIVCVSLVLFLSLSSSPSPSLDPSASASLARRWSRGASLMSLYGTLAYKPDEM